MKTRAQQTGFTLIEIAIVLVIIGLLLGGVMKGQEMIANAKIKSLVDQAKSLAASVYTYQDKYGAYPGDDPKAKTNLVGTKAGCVAGDLDNGNGNGQITEYYDAPEHLVCANLITGSYNGSSDFMKHRFGGNVIIYYETVSGLTGNDIRFYSLPAEVGKALDRALDDGIYNKGSVRATGDYTAVRNVSYFY